MNKKAFILLPIILILNVNAYLSTAQSLGLGSSINYTSNGINLYYNNEFGSKKQWGINAGIRITVNTYAINNNYQNHVFYQTGYANTFTEHFGINLRGYRQVFKYKKLRLDYHLDIFTVNQSILYKSNIYDIDRNILDQSVTYWKPAINLEVTTGLQFQYSINHKINLVVASGLGIAYHNYQYESGWDKTNNVPIHWFRDAKNPNKDRGDISVTGLDGFPMISLALKYKLF